MADDRVMDLLVEWEERRRVGQPATADELCPDDSWLREELRGRIARRQKLARVLEPTTAPETKVERGDAIDPIPEIPGYEILEVIGHGGMGIVYKARHVALGRVVALKMILAGQAATASERCRFLNEAQASARLSHQNIVQVYEVGEAGGRPYLAMEFVADGSLAGILTDAGIDPRLAAQLLGPLAEAVQHAHDHGIVHRDLKPANILIVNPKSAGELVPKVADFGLAKRLDGERGHTQTGAILGSPNYMSPEQALGSTDVGPMADVYALGAIFYEMLTGRPPFRAGTFLETLEMVRMADPIPPRQFRAKLDRDLELICLKCLEKDPARRYPSAAALADDLRRFLAGEAISVRADGLGLQLKRILSRTDIDRRVARFARTVVWLAPIGIGSQGIAYLGWRDSPNYPYIAIGTLAGAICVMFVILLGTNQSWMREIPATQRRHHRTTWLANMIACALVIFVISWTSRFEHPEQLMVIIPLMAILTGTSILAQASQAGWMYGAGLGFYAMAVLMALDLSLAGLEVGVLMTGNIIYQYLWMHRLDDGPGFAAGEAGRSSAKGLKVPTS